jgi:hypothetical protein
MTAATVVRAPKLWGGGRSPLSGASIGAFTEQCPIAERGRDATFLLKAAPERPREGDLRPTASASGAEYDRVSVDSYIRFHSAAAAVRARAAIAGPSTWTRSRSRTTQRPATTTDRTWLRSIPNSRWPPTFALVRGVGGR